MTFVSFFCHKFVIRKFILPFLSLGYEDKFIHITEVEYNNIQFETKKNGLLSETFTPI